MTGAPSCQLIELKDYKFHPNHTLRLLQCVEHDRKSYCQICRYRIYPGFAYSCATCDYHVDIVCAHIPEQIRHKSHPRHRLTTIYLDDNTMNTLRNQYCRMCLSGFTYPRLTSFFCDICDFHLHPECALLLPETIRHKYDKHPLTLSYSPIEDHEGDYFCEVCEEELDHNSFFYHCRDCVQSIHSACVMEMLDVTHTKAFINALACRRGYKVWRKPTRSGAKMSRSE